MTDRRRRTRFESRIELERNFLTPVNDAFSGVAPLTGMTAAAIENWLARANLATNAHHFDTLASLLREASLRSQLLSDNSKEVFETAARPREDSLGVTHQMLAQEIDRLRQLSI